MVNSNSNGGYNRTLVFAGENYMYWKNYESSYRMVYYMEVWQSVKNGSFMLIVENERIDLDKSEDNRQMLRLRQYRMTGRHATFSSLLLDSINITVYPTINLQRRCGIPCKSMSINILTQEYELFHMK
jgi:hypothetical protein